MDYGAKILHEAGAGKFFDKKVKKVHFPLFSCAFSWSPFFDNLLFRSLSCF